MRVIDWVPTLWALLLGAAWGAVAGSRRWRAFTSRGPRAAAAAWVTAALVLVPLFFLVFARFGSL